MLVYSNAFNGLTADLEFTYRRSGMSQDIVIRQQPLPPSAYGLNPASTRLQVLTEFYNAPAPVKTTVTNNGLADDRNLNFGDMQMGVGGAFFFQSNGATNAAGSVAKHWTNLDGNTYLIEDIPAETFV